MEWNDKMSQQINLERLLATTTVKGVTDLLLNLGSNIRWRPVGGRENNLATINLGTDPAAGLVERITNAIDAVLELEWVRRGSPTNIRSPREAVETWFGIQEGRLENVTNARDRAIVTLSSRVIISLHDSERNDRPTVDIRDQGVGLLSTEFGDTILSLNQTVKLKKFFLAGAFGQGGSTALSYSQYTIIISRKFSLFDQHHPIAFTIVRFNPGDPNTDKHGVYEYSVSSANGYPIELEVPYDEFPHGTLVRHVHMDLGKYVALLTAPVRSLWYLTHHYLFDPVIPFRIREERENKSKGEERFIGGNHRRLTLDKEHIEYTQEAIRTFRSGSVSLTWWVIHARTNDPDKEEQTKDRITNYCQPSKPIIITYNGQKQGELPNSVIKNDLKLPYLERYIVVHVDCDKLDGESRRQLFPTTREMLRDTSILDELRQLVIETLAQDQELVRLDRERKRRYLERGENQSAENLRRRLANRVSQLMQEGGQGKAPSSATTPEGGASNPLPPIPIQDPPTFLEIMGPDTKEVIQDRPFALRFMTDADPAYFRSTESFIAVIDPPSIGLFTGSTSIRNGYGVAYFRCSGDAAQGEEGEITLELRPRRARTIKDTVRVRVVAPPEATSPKGGERPVPNINPQWVDREHLYWIDNNWNDKSVAAAEIGTDSIDIFVSSENRRLNTIIARAQRKGLASVDAVKDFYIEHISFHALVARLAEERAKKANNNDEEPERDLTPERTAELERVCETICGVIDQMFDLLITGSHRAEHD